MLRHILYFKIRHQINKQVKKGNTDFYFTENMCIYLLNDKYRAYVISKLRNLGFSVIYTYYVDRCTHPYGFDKRLLIIWNSDACGDKPNTYAYKCFRRSLSNQTSD